MWLPWEYGFALAGLFAALWWVLRGRADRRGPGPERPVPKAQEREKAKGRAGTIVSLSAKPLRLRRPTLSAFAGEAAIVSVLYSLWQLAGRLSLLGIDAAGDRGAWLWDLERSLLLPSEVAWQEAMVPHSLLTQVANIYYFSAHVPAMGIFLVWLFARHRSSYCGWRNTLALFTGVCLLIQLLPVAPPRLTDETGMIDTGLAYGQSMYGNWGEGSPASSWQCHRSTSRGRPSPAGRPRSSRRTAGDGMALGS